MEYFYKSAILLLVIFTSIPPLKTHCQENLNAPEFIKDAYDFIQAKYGSDQVLINGVYFEDIYKKDLEHPFLGEDIYSLGYIVIHNKRYNNIMLKYNLFDQNIVVQNSNSTNNPFAFIPPIDFISEFSFDEKVFKKHQFSGKAEGFYQIIYEGDLNCLYEWSKKREESHHNVRYAAFKYNKAVRKSYLIVNNSLVKYRTKWGFFKLFPKERKKEIATYFKSHKIKLKKSSDKEIAELISYCEELLHKNYNSK